MDNWGYNHTRLVVSTHLKNISQIGIISPSRSENKQLFETTTQIMNGWLIVILISWLIIVPDTFLGAPCHSTYNNRLGAHKLQAAR